MAPPSSTEKGIDMSRLRLRKPSPAMAVALVALMISLGGTSYAAFGPFRGDSLIVKHSLSGNRLEDHSVDGTQLRVRFFPKVPTATWADVAGTANVASSANSATTAGSLSGVSIVVGQDTTAPANGSKTGEVVDCPPGTVAIAGGVRTRGNDIYVNNIRIAANIFGTPNSEVRASVTNMGTSDDSYHVQAVCIHGQVTGGEP
jgi:hypothetical protein